MKTYARAAYVAHARNLDGSVVCKGADGLPFLLAVGQQVHFVPPTLRGPRTAVVRAVSARGQDTWDVSFEGVDSIDSSESIVGSYCLVADDELPAMSPEDEPALLAGFAVEDEALGTLGEVAAVEGSAEQALLVVEGPYGQVLVPFVDALVLNVDETSRIVTTSVPEGLVHLNDAPASEGVRP